MNKQRRKDITDLVERVKAVTETLNDALGDIESIKGEEEEAFENMPEGLQESEAGQRAQESAEALSEAYGTLESLLDTLEEVTTSLETAAE